MKESISGIALFNIVIVFVILFTGYVSLSINYSKAYNVKNEILNIIKNQGGVCTSDVASSDNNCHNFKVQITDYFSEANYRSLGDCDAGFVGYNRDGDVIGLEAENAAICIKGINANGDGTATNSELPNSVYYQVEVFYQLDLPIFSKMFEFSIKGETARVYSPNECKHDSSNYNWCVK